MNRKVHLTLQDFESASWPQTAGSCDATDPTLKRWFFFNNRIRRAAQSYGQDNDSKRIQESAASGEADRRDFLRPSLSLLPPHRLQPLRRVGPE